MPLAVSGLPALLPKWALLPSSSAHFSPNLLLTLLLALLLPGIFLCYRGGSLLFVPSQSATSEKRRQQWQRGRALFRAVSPHRLRASIRSHSKLISRTTHRRLISKLKSTGRDVNVHLKATHHSIRKMSQVAKTKIQQKSLSASSVTARSAFKGVAARAMHQALGEQDNARLSSVLVDRQVSAFRHKRLIDDDATALPTICEGASTEQAASNDPGPLPSDESPWDRLHAWLVEGDGLPYRPPCWPFHPYVVVSADVDEAFAKQVREGQKDACAPQAVSAYEFRVRAQYMDVRRPVWDEKGLLCYRRGDATHFRVLLAAQSRLTSGLWNADALNPFGMLRILWRTIARLPPPPLWQASLELPTAGKGWETQRVAVRGGGNLTLKVRVTAWEDRPVRRLPRIETPPPPLSAGAGDLPGREGKHEGELPTRQAGSTCERWRRACGMQDHILELEGGERAVVSYCLAAQGLERLERGAGEEGGREAVSDNTYASSAVLWIPGRNDAFFHWHLLPVLWGAGFDLYILSYRRVGECLRMGFVPNPMHVSHCASGDFGEYHEEITAAVDFLQGGGGNDVTRYSRLLCYTHSTGAAILLHYLMSHGDKRFDGFVFNSPFLSWGWEVSPLTLHIIRYAPSVLMALRLWSAATELTKGGRPSEWALQFYSQYEFDPASRPLYNVPLTVGFSRGVNRESPATPLLYKP
ncbi:MAG: hypothetical protein SGPRY_007350 [Prymnesium sp.]